MATEPTGGDNHEDSSRDTFGAPRLSDVLNYRKVAIAVVSTYVGLEDRFVDAVLTDQMEEYLQAQEPDRERLKAERYDEYLGMLGREVLVRYAATAAESLASDPDRGTPTPTLSHCDDLNAVARVHEIFEFLESPDSDDAAENHLLQAKRHLCGYYSSCAANLVCDQLLPVIIAAGEELYRKGTLTADRTRELIIASEKAGA
jgi:hypothetical protein